MGTKTKLFWIIGLTYLVIGILGYKVIQNLVDNVVQYQAISFAENIANQVTIARTVYNEKIVNKLKRDGYGAHLESDAHPGFVPLPAQFLKMVGSAIYENSDHLFYYQPISKWHLGPDQGLNDDFLQWGWEQLEAQDQIQPTQAIDWQPAWRIEEKNGLRTLRYLVADPASLQSCVNCHNQHETRQDIIDRRKSENVETGKQWRLHQLMGALSITIHLNKVETIATKQIRQTVIVGTSILTFIFLLIGWFMFSRFCQYRVIENLSWEVGHDALTNLQNRRGFEQDADLLLKSARERNLPLALALIDIDNFKKINDGFGHQAGDETLKELAKIINSCVRQGDITARLGGDEFIVVFYDCNKENAERLTSNICKMANATDIKHHDSTITFSISIGLTILNNRKISLQTLMAEADKACYQAKKKGKNQVFIY